MSKAVTMPTSTLPQIDAAIAAAWERDADTAYLDTLLDLRLSHSGGHGG